MGEAYERWARRTCCCRHPDPHVCEELRHGLKSAEENDYEGCDCSCHVELAADEDDGDYP
jgi:hypothetical protein